MISLLPSGATIIEIAVSRPRVTWHPGAVGVGGGKGGGGGGEWGSGGGLETGSGGGGGGGMYSPHSMRKPECS